MNYFGTTFCTDFGFGIDFTSAIRAYFNIWIDFVSANRAIVFIHSFLPANLDKFLSLLDFHNLDRMLHHLIQRHNVCIFCILWVFFKSCILYMLIGHFAYLLTGCMLVSAKHTFKDQFIFSRFNIKF